MVYYEPVKIIINALGLAKVIINAVIHHPSFSNSIISDQKVVFNSKFWSLLCYFLCIKRRLFIAFYLQTNGQTKRQNSIMDVYLRVFVHFEQDDWARFLPMAKFTYNNAKNIRSGHTLFELNCGYHPQISYRKNIDPCFKSKTVNKLSAELWDFISTCCKNLFYAQKLQKRAYDKDVKPRSYAPSDKVLLNNKFIKTKQNKKLEAHFFELFQVLHPVKKQAYKLELSKK